MKKKIFLTLIMICTLIVTGCTKSNDYSSTFKYNYEAINGEVSTVSGKTFRTISISDDNPFVSITSSEILEKVENKESFFLYIGSEYCPWCRSVIESMIKSAKQNGVSTIYYLEAWDGDHVESLRDKYEIDENENVTEVSSGDENYSKLLELFSEYLEDYTLTDSNGNEVNVGEKRIYIPSLFYVKNGIANAYTDGISDKQESSLDELTDEIISDEISKFNSVFNKINTCDDKC